jgi:hypothetical protein
MAFKTKVTDGSRMVSEDVQVMNATLAFPDRRHSLLIPLFLSLFEDDLSQGDVMYGKAKNISV